MSFYWLSVMFILLPTLITGQAKPSNQTNNTWTPKDNGTISIGNLMALTGFKMSKSKNFTRKLSMSSLPGTKVTACNNNATCLPKNFSWLVEAKERGLNCPSLAQIRMQLCGDCWAVATAAIISDRHCLQTNESRIFSALEISRCSITDGCHGGDPKDAIDYYKQYGVVTGGDVTIGAQRKGCQPYFASNVTACEAQCHPTYDIPYKQDKRKGVHGYQITSRNVDDIKIDLQTYGPLVATLDIYDDFENYKHGIYQRQSSKLKGGHAVRLLGWGEENDVPYWLCANNWGTNWGDNGFFRIILGKNETNCNIESYLHGVQTHDGTVPFITAAPLNIEPTTTATQKPKTSATQNPTTTASQKPTTTATEKPKTSATQKPTTTASQKPTTTATEKPKTSATQKPTTTATDVPTTTETQKPKTTATLEPTTIATEEPKPVTMQTPTLVIIQEPDMVIQEPKIDATQEPAMIATEEPKLTKKYETRLEPEQPRPPPVKHNTPTPKRTRPPPVKHITTPTPRKISNDQACRTMAVKAGGNNICIMYAKCCKQHCNSSGAFRTNCQYEDVGTVVFDNVNTFCHCY